MWQQLVRQLVNPMVLELEDRLFELTDRFRQMGLALLVIRFSLGFWGLGTIFLLLALFFRLAEQSQLLVSAAVITGLVSWAIGVILTTIGVRLFRDH